MPHKPKQNKKARLKKVLKLMREMSTTADALDFSGEQWMQLFIIQRRVERALRDK